eukprot:CAMPEP_0172501220 /NCGR_PEP_ID=MMETSP1066-20121228/147477_1 /TAXON_ID=671091 /ORGANISM="Coscinodiscus wailesii, Strain CCMP2513" /LENGTH=301 /DNA_ID=CAMNT_0013275887 /DNA_START=114 /DNA_END=1019 /DNA_ORIENTATION=-
MSTWKTYEFQQQHHQFQDNDVTDNDNDENNDHYDGDKKNKRTTTTKNPNNGFVYTNNIMVDSRVVRGNTYASPVITEEQRRVRTVNERNRRIRLAKQKQLEMEEDRRRRRRLSQLALLSRDRPGTPPPVSGRVHMDIQTDPLVEELGHGKYSTSLSRSRRPKSIVVGTQTLDVDLSEFGGTPLSLSSRRLECEKVDGSNNGNAVKTLPAAVTTVAKEVRDEVEHKSCDSHDGTNSGRANDGETENDSKVTNDPNNDEMKELTKEILNDVKKSSFSMLEKEGYFRDGYEMTEQQQQQETKCY